jgi:glycosyltransferase involved in cell wall biosynthesis
MLISIIVPIYNAEKFLKRSIESVINQSYKKIELILVNDGSTDQSEMICNQYALTDKRIKVVTQKNSGPAAARNTGIRCAKGDFIFFLDADDLIASNALEVLIANYNKYHPDLVMANFCKLENNGEIIKQNATFSPDTEPFTGKIKFLSKADMIDYVKHFLKHPSNHLISYCWGRLYKSSIIKKNNIFVNEDMRLFEDFVFNLEYLKYTNKTVFVNEPLYTYVMHNNYLSASMIIINSNSLVHDMNVFKKKASEFSEQISDKEIGHCLFHYATIFLVRSCRQVNKSTKKDIYNEIKKFVNTPILMESLKHYSPSKGNTRILPILAKLKLVNLIILYCQYKAYKRYGRPKNKQN